MNTSATHEPDVLCFICEQMMGPHNPVLSLQMVCCQSGEWFHLQCLRKQANTLEDYFVCPKCPDVDNFRENMLLNGVYIPKSSAVALYNSLVGENVENEPPQKRRRIHKEWIFEQAFKNKQEADSFIKDGFWGYNYRTNSENGIRIVFRCKHLKDRGEQCGAAVYLLYDSRSTLIQQFRADSEHTHANHSNSVQTIPIELQSAIELLFKNNVTKPKAVKANLRKNNLAVPPHAKLQTCLKKLIDAKYGKEKLNCGTLEKWLVDVTPLPDSDTEPFALGYELNYEDEANIDFRFVITTKQLLKLAIGSNRIHADATYKLNWQVKKS